MRQKRRKTSIRTVKFNVLILCPRGSNKIADRQSIKDGAALAHILTKVIKSLALSEDEAPFLRIRLPYRSYRWFVRFTEWNCRRAALKYGKQLVRHQSSSDLFSRSVNNKTVGFQCFSILNCEQQLFIERFHFLLSKKRRNRFTSPESVRDNGSDI